MAADDELLVAAWRALPDWPVSNLLASALYDAATQAVRKRAKKYPNQDESELLSELVFRVIGKAVRGPWPTTDVTAARVRGYLRRATRNLGISLWRNCKRRWGGDRKPLPDDLEVPDPLQWKDFATVRAQVEREVILGDPTLGPARQEAATRFLDERLRVQRGELDLGDLLGVDPGHPDYKRLRNNLDQKHGRAIEQLEESLGRWRKRNHGPEFDQDYKHMQGLVNGLRLYGGNTP